MSSPLFRDPTKVRGGAVPGWAAYNDALDKHPLTAKACTSLVGWALGDVLAQVRHDVNYVPDGLDCLRRPVQLVRSNGAALHCLEAALARLQRPVLPIPLFCFVLFSLLCITYSPPFRFVVFHF